jgi:hypothetical protein
MTEYRHRQFGTLLFWAVGLAAALLAFLLYYLGPNPVGVAVLILLLLCLALFWTLTVEVNETRILLRFGAGLIRKTFPLAAIRRASAVRNEWYYGWGIRMLPKGWLYNVSGLDAIELEMINGRIDRIGTDQPAELLAAIEEARRRRLGTGRS